MPLALALFAKGLKMTKQELKEEYRKPGKASRKWRRACGVCNGSWRWGKFAKWCRKPAW
ncbi:hypothetical protein QT343_25530 [Escherichia coli]|nr:hypothetical protein [Escherichia coli]